VMITHNVIKYNEAACNTAQCVCVCVMITHNVIKYFITYCLDRGFKEEFSEY